MFFANSSPRYSAPMNTKDEAMMFRGVNFKTPSGIIVNENTALNLTAVYAAVTFISDVMGSLPCDVIRKEKNGDITPQDGHPVEEIMNHEINDVMDAMNVRNLSQQGVLLRGNGYMEIERNGAGEVKAMWPLLPEVTYPSCDSSTGELFYRTIINKKNVELDPSNVHHVMNNGPNGYEGWSQIRLHRDAMGLGLALQTFGAKFFANDAKSGGFFTHPAKLSDKARDNIKGSIKEQGGIENSHDVKVLEEGMKYVATTISPDDSQFLGSREFQIAEIARIYRIPLVLLQSMEKTSSWGSGIEQLCQAFATFTLVPWCTRWEQQSRRKLLSEKEKAAGFGIKLNLNALLRGDSAARAAFLKSAIETGWMNRNEARRLENMNSVNGLDKFIVPANMQVLGSQGTDQNQGGNNNNAKILP